MVEQALKVLEQGLDLATANGAFKSTKDAATLSNALDIVKGVVEKQSKEIEVLKEEKVGAVDGSKEAKKAKK